MGKLNDRHRQDLASSGLTEETILLSGCYSASGAAAAEFLGFDAGVSLVIPYPHTAENGKPPFRRAKPDEPFTGPDGKPAKYLSPKRELNPQGNRLYAPPNLPAGALEDSSVPLIITEGEKKALAGCQEGFPTVGLAGVACWVTKNGSGESEPIADLDLINWEGRHVTIVFDSDAATKPEVKREEGKLAAELSRRGAEVRIARLPRPRPSEDRQHGLGGKSGMDDFLKVRGRAAFQQVFNCARRVKVARNKPNMGAAADLAEEFLEDRDYRQDGILRLRWWREEFYRFNGTCYERLPEGDLKAEVNTLLQEHPKHRRDAGSGLTKAIIENLQALTYVDSVVEPPALLGDEPDEREMVSLSNGIIALEALLAARLEALQPHTPEYFSLSSLPFPLDPAADCKRWLAFLEEMLPDPTMQALVQEMFGYLLVNDASQEKFFLLEGLGANGKTVVCTALREILGESNVSAVGLEAFSATRTFPLAATVGMKANIVEELDEITKAAEGTLKNFVTAKPMTIERKFKNAFNFTPTARLVFATNVLPRFIDRTDGLWRRMILIPFRKQILDETKQDKRLIDPKWWRKSGELPAIFLWAIGGLANLRQRGYFLEPEACRVEKNTYRRESNPAGTFVIENCESVPGVLTSSSTLYGTYNQWAEDHGYKPLGAQQFAKEVKKVFPQVELTEHPRRIDGRRSRVWIGLGFIRDG